jgi:hypothetical protein
MRCRHQTRCSFIPHKVYDRLDEKALHLTKDDTVYLLDYCGPPGLVQHLGELAGRQAWCGSLHCTAG